eukprot:14037524-Alexandrium_andersonii.AAC.1
MSRQPALRLRVGKSSNKAKPQKPFSGHRKRASAGAFGRPSSSALCASASPSPRRRCRQLRRGAPTMGRRRSP